MLGCHKPVVPVAIFLTPLAWNSQVPKDRWATLSRSVFILKIKIMWAFALLLSARFPFSLSSPEDTCVTLWQMYRHSQTPRLTRSSEQIASRPKTAALEARTVVRRPVFALLNKWKNDASYLRTQKIQKDFL